MDSKNNEKKKKSVKSKSLTAVNKRTQEIRNGEKVKRIGR